MNQIILNWVGKVPALSGHEQWIIALISSSLVVVLAMIAYLIAKRVVVNFIHRLFSKTNSELDDIFIHRNVFGRIARLAPSFVIYKLAPQALESYPVIVGGVLIAVSIYFVLVCMLIVDALIDSLADIYRQFEISKHIPIQSFVQVAKLLVYFVAIITVISLIIGESPLTLFAGLGAMTAVLMLVFKDPILGFVAGIHLSYNKMVAIGDWVEIPQHKADGDIMEIGLTTVKVRNFDNTITTVPTQSLINDSFKNWRGMQESGGRRIKRCLYIDVNSINFCDQERIQRYRKINYISEYIDAKLDELKQYNAQHSSMDSTKINGRHITNIGTFRAYVQAYLKNHPKINKRLTLLVRQLAPTDKGLPIEIYVFSADKNWINYEGIQSDIFDHLFAVIPEFDLRVFQQPTGLDFSTLNPN